MNSKEKIVETYKKGYRINKEGDIINPKGKKINGYKHISGRIHFQIVLNNKKYCILVHRLQAYQKFGDSMFEDGIEVRHLNNIPNDNSWDNIAIGTHTENIADIPKEQFLEVCRINGLKSRKFDYKKITDFYLEYKDKELVKNTFNIGKVTLNYILRKQSINN